MATKKPDEEKVHFCSFCGKSQYQVKRLMSGPSVFICDECVGLCNDMLAHDTRTTKVPVKEMLPTPKEMIAKLNEHIIGQSGAKEVLAVAAYQHYKRMAHKGEEQDGVEIEKSNVLLIGPTGSGKTLLAETLAQMLQVPFAQEDLTGVTEAGWRGKDVESVLVRLVEAANGDVSKAEFGIVWLDEADKIGRKDSMSNINDLGGPGVQHALLKMVEGTDIEIPTGKKTPMGQETVTLNTKNILFIFGGAFDGLEKSIAKRLRGGRGGIGFNADPSLGNNAVHSKSLIHDVTSRDLEMFGFDPQLIGRLPRIATLDELDEAALKRILTEPKNALLRQFAKTISQDGAKLLCDEEAVIEIARIAMREKTGARALKAICGKIFHSTFLNLPTLQKEGENIVTVHLTADHVQGNLPPQLIRGKSHKALPKAK